MELKGLQQMQPGRKHLLPMSRRNSTPLIRPTAVTPSSSNVLPAVVQLSSSGTITADNAANKKKTDECLKDNLENLFLISLAFCVKWIKTQLFFKRKRAHLDYT